MLEPGADPGAAGAWPPGAGLAAGLGRQAGPSRPPRRSCRCSAGGWRVRLRAGRHSAGLCAAALGPAAAPAPQDVEVLQTAGWLQRLSPPGRGPRRAGHACRGWSNWDGTVVTRPSRSWPGTACLVLLRQPALRQPVLLLPRRNQPPAPAQAMIRLGVGPSGGLGYPAWPGAACARCCCARGCRRARRRTPPAAREAGFEAERLVDAVRLDAIARGVRLERSKIINATISDGSSG